MTWRHRAVSAILALCAALLASCWDKAELSELALISMVGLDRDPESGLYGIYLQTVNPASGISAQGTPGGEQAPVYTYSVSGKSLAETQVTFYKLLPRKIFIPHAKAILISGRAAEQGLLDFLNFSELLPDARSSIPILVVDDSIAEVMRTFTPLERNPAESITSRLKLLYERAMMSGRHIEVRDIIEQSAKGEMTVLPMIAVTARRGNPTSGEKNTEINADINQFMINGGAVIRNFRMVGRLNDSDLVLYHLLNGGKGQFVRRIPFQGEHITANMRCRRARKQLEWQDGKPVVRVRLELEISTISMSEFHPQTLDDVMKLEKQVNRSITGELTAFVNRTRERGWDLLRIRSLLRRKAPRLPDLDRAADNAEVRIEVRSTLTGMGNLSRLYGRTGGER